MRRFVYPLVFLVAVTGFVLGGSIQATFFQKPIHQGSLEKFGEEAQGQKKDETFWERTTGDPIALYTLVLTGFTGVLAWATYGLLRETRKLAKLGADQSVATENSITLVGHQLDLAKKDHALQREEYFTAHRPRVAVRRMETVPSFRTPTIISFTIVNTGEAAISSCIWNGHIMLLESIGAIHGVIEFDRNNEGFHSEKIAVGAGINRELKNTDPLDGAEIRNITSGKEVLHVIGYVAYADTLGVKRRTGFFRYYDPERRRFRVVDDPEYEYQD